MLEERLGKFQPPSLNINTQQVCNAGAFMVHNGHQDTLRDEDQLVDWLDCWCVVEYFMEGE